MVQGMGNVLVGLLAARCTAAAAGPHRSPQHETHSLHGRSLSNPDMPPGEGPSPARLLRFALEPLAAEGECPQSCTRDGTKSAQHDGDDALPLLNACNADQVVT